jgi:G3E family GTPase
MTTPHKINATIITGFLGAGKTTFINNLLRKYPEKQFALVENEFGEISIDTRLIKGVDASHLFELKNGCICCTITNEYELVLLELAERFPHVDELLIETTGIADPAQVIKPFTDNPEIRKLYEFQGIVCVADAGNLDSHLQEKVSVRQLISAGAIVISKAEGFSHEEQTTLVNRMKEINSLAPVFYTSQNHSEFEPGNYWNNKPLFWPDHLHRDKMHGGFSSKTIRFNHHLSRSEFEYWLSYFLDVHNNEIYRAKGIVYFIDEPFEYIVQAVGSSWEIKEGDLALDHKNGVLVFVGKLADISFDGIG